MPIEFFSTLGAIIGLGVLETARDLKASKAKPLQIRDIHNRRQYELSVKSYKDLCKIYYDYYGDVCPGIKLASAVGGEQEVLDRTLIIMSCMLYGIMEAEQNPLDRTLRYRCWYCPIHKYQCKWKEARTLPIIKYPYPRPEDPTTNPEIYNDSEYNKWD